MPSERRLRLLLGGIAVVSLAGAIDAAIGRVWDQLAILSVVIALVLITLVSASTQRPTVTIRADLMRWLRRRSAIEGEPVDALIDRSIAAYREHLRPGRTGPT